MVWDAAAREKAQATLKARREAKLAAKSLGNVETQTEVAPKVEGSGGNPSPSPKAPPPNLFSGTVKKLEVFGKPGTDPHEPIKGYQLYWFDDIEGGLIIQQAKASGWEMVRKDEIALNDANTSPGNNDLGGDVRRWVSQGPSGSAVFAYLMKKPNWLHELHLTGPDSLEQKVHQKIDEQLRAGTFNENPNDRRYTSANPYPGTRSGLPPIQMGRYYKPPQT